MFYSFAVAGTGNSPIALVNHRQQSFSVTARVTVPSTETATYSVYESLDDPETQLICTLSRTGTTATLTYTNHGLNVSDWVLVRDQGSVFDGLFQVASVVDANNITYTVANSGATAGTSFANFAPIRTIVPTALSAKTATAENTWTAPIRVLIMKISAHSVGTGSLVFEVLQGSAK